MEDKDRHDVSKEIKGSVVTELQSVIYFFLYTLSEAGNAVEACADVVHHAICFDISLVCDEDVDHGRSDNDSNQELGDGDLEVELLIVHRLLPYKPFFDAQRESSNKDAQAEVKKVFQLLPLCFSQLTSQDIFSCDKSAQDGQQAGHENETPSDPMLAVWLIPKQQPAHEEV